MNVYADKWSYKLIGSAFISYNFLQGYILILSSQNKILNKYLEYPKQLSSINTILISFLKS